LTQKWQPGATEVHAPALVKQVDIAIVNIPGILRVLVGRSLGALSHGSWGIIITWFAWRGWARHGDRRGNWAAALLVPALLHATENASLVDVPGATDLPDGVMPPLAAIMIVLSGMAVMVASVALACWCIIRSRRMDALAGGGRCRGVEDDAQGAGAVQVAPKRRRPTSVCREAIGSFDYFCALLLPLAPPFLPAVKRVPLKTPTAKKAKYMRAAESLSILGKIGGSDNPTVWRLFMPMMTKSSRIKTRKIVLSSSLKFISRFCVRLGSRMGKGKVIHGDATAGPTGP
jgi:hypothetical protein